MYINPHPINPSGAHVSYGSDRPRKDTAIQDAIVAVVAVIFARGFAQSVEYEAPGLAFLLRTIVPIGAVFIWLLRRFVPETGQPYLNHTQGSEYVEVEMEGYPYYYLPQHPNVYFYQDRTTRAYYPIEFDQTRQTYYYNDGRRVYHPLPHFTSYQQRPVQSTPTYPSRPRYVPPVPGPTTPSALPATTTYSVYGSSPTPQSSFSSPAYTTYSVGGDNRQHGPSHDPIRPAPAYRPGTYPPGGTNTYEVK